MPLEKKVLILSCLVEGSSICSISRLTGAGISGRGKSFWVSIRQSERRSEKQTDPLPNLLKGVCKCDYSRNNQGEGFPRFLVY